MTFRLFAIGVLLAFVCGLASAQEKERLTCPTFSVVGPSGIAMPGELFVYTSSIKGTIPRDLIYRWSVLKGSIVDGQGTPTIKVAPDPESDTVTLELIGLPQGCPNIASESFVSDHSQEPILIDEFSAPMSSLEKERFKFAVTEQKDNPNNILYIIEYVNKDTPSFAIREKIGRLTEFLVKELKLPETYLTVVTEKSDKPLTRIYRIPPGATKPQP